MKNTRGFALIEGLLILVIIGILGGTGWYVYNSQTNSNKNLDNAVATSNSSIIKQKKSTTSSYRTNTVGINAANSTSCKYLDSSNDSNAIDFTSFLKDTPEIKSFEAGNSSYSLVVGSICTLDNGDSVASFSDSLSSRTTIKYGLIAKTEAGPIYNIGLQCAYIAPSPSNPPEIKSIIKGIATVDCPGYQGAIYNYSFAMDSFTKTGQQQAPACLEGSC